MKYADIVVPRGVENKVALKLIVHHIKDKLKKVKGCQSCWFLSGNVWVGADFGQSKSLNQLNFTTSLRKYSPDERLEGS